MLSWTVEALNDVLQRGLLKLGSQLADFTAKLMHYTTDCSRADALLKKGKPSLLLSASCATEAKGVVLLSENQPECLSPSIPAARGGSETKKFDFDLDPFLNGAQGSHLSDLLTSTIDSIRLIIARNGLNGRVWYLDLGLWKQAMLLAAPAPTKPTKQALAQVPKLKCLDELEWILHQSQTA